MNRENDQNDKQRRYPGKGIADEQFEQNAKVKILKGKESYRGGSGYYSLKGRTDCPNVTDNGSCQLPE